MALSIGTVAPDFTLRTLGAEGLEDRTLSSFKGQKNVVLLFFPAAFTGVCTQEMCDTTSGLGRFADANAEVFGISGDSAFALDAWAKQNNIGVTLLSDYGKAVSYAYDVVLPDLVGMGPAAKRAAFVIDRDGIFRNGEETPTPLELPNFSPVHEVLNEFA